MLERFGTPAVSCAYELSNACADSTIISDRSVRDSELLRMLFGEAGFICPFEIESAQEFMCGLTTDPSDGGGAEIDRAMALAALKYPGLDAEASARRLREAVAILVAIDESGAA
jgi:hypothetical protein